MSRRKLNYWLDKGIISADVDAARGRGRVRLWSFSNLVEVKTAVWLRDKVPLQLMGNIVGRLRKQGIGHPLGEVTVGVIENRNAKQRVMIQRDDGTWEQGYDGQVPMILRVPLTTFRSELEQEALADRRARRRPGAVEKQRGRLGSAEVFAGTRVPVATVARLLAAGWSAQRIVENYPGITLEDVQAARRRTA